MKKKETNAPLNYSIEERNHLVRQWLKDHDLINIAKLCRRINYDRGNFWHFEDDTRDLQEPHITALEQALVYYGYQIK